MCKLELCKTKKTKQYTPCSFTLFLHSFCRFFLSLIMFSPLKMHCLKFWAWKLVFFYMFHDWSARPKIYTQAVGKFSKWKRHGDNYYNIGGKCLHCVPCIHSNIKSETLSQRDFEICKFVTYTITIREVFSVGPWICDRNLQQQFMYFFETWDSKALFHLFLISRRAKTLAWKRVKSNSKVFYLFFDTANWNIHEWH